MAKTTAGYRSAKMADLMLTISLSLHNKTEADFGYSSHLPREYKYALFAQEINPAAIVEDHMKILTQLLKNSAQEIRNAKNSHATRLAIVQILTTGEGSKNYPATSTTIRLINFLTSSEFQDKAWSVMLQTELPSYGTPLSDFYNTVRRSTKSCAASATEESNFWEALSMVLKDAPAREMLTQTTEALEEISQLFVTAVLVSDGGVTTWKKISAPYIKTIITVKALEDRRV